jgi:sialic acid synthase SpsE
VELNRSPSVRVGGRRLGGGAPCFVVAEAGSSHQGEMSRALELIEAAQEAGADCVKFQVIFADEIVHPRTGAIELPGGRIPIYDRFRELERGSEFYARLKEHAEGRGVAFLASAFGPKSARLLRDLGVAAIKVASPELNHLPLLRELAGYGLPLILSSGVSSLGDIEKALRACAPPGPEGQVPEVVLLHCLTAYPAPEEQYNLRLIPNLRRIFGVPVGISDHSLEAELVPVLAVLEGVCLLEKHLALSRAGSGLDDPVALEPAAFAGMVRAVREAEGAQGQPYLEARLEARQRLERRFGRERLESVLGDGVKRLAPAEEGFYRTTRRSLHARGEIRAGERITAGMVCIVRSERNLRPGLEPELLPLVLGRSAQRDIRAGEGITWEDLLPPADAGEARGDSPSGSTR